MNKKELAAAIAEKLCINKYEAYNFSDLLIETICEKLATGDKVVISRFGTFLVKQKNKKRVINPNTKTMMIIPPTRVIKFIPAKNLKKTI